MVLALKSLGGCSISLFGFSATGVAGFSGAFAVFDFGGPIETCLRYESSIVGSIYYFNIKENSNFIEIYRIFLRKFLEHIELQLLIYQHHL